MSEYIYDWTPNKQHAKEEIVRCRDCVYYEDGWCHEPGPDGTTKGWYVGKPGDGFCAWGERRTNDN